MPTISLTPAPLAQTIPRTKVTFDVVLQGFTVGEHLDVSFWEKAGSDEDGSKADRTLGLASGSAAMKAGTSRTPQFTLLPDEAPPAPPPPAPAGQPQPLLVAFRFAGGVKPDGTSGTVTTYIFEITGDRVDVNEGEWWEFQVQINNVNVNSAVFPIARIRRQLFSNQATYDWHDGNTTTFYHDGSTDANGSGGAFKDMLQAIADAQHFVFIADWSFQPMFCPGHGPTINDTIGKKLIQKAASTLVAIHTWDHTAPMGIGAPDPQNDDGEDVLDELAGGTRPDKLLWRASSHDQTGMSHHQKYVLVDCEGAGGRRDLKAFFGGLDLTQGRFDWGAHPILPGDPQCAKFRTSLTLDGESYNDWYNAEFGGQSDLPRQPWHDIQGSIKGAAAWDFVREFVGRWNVDPAYPDAQGNDSNDDIKTVLDKFKELFDRTKFVQQWEAHRGPWAAQVYRSMFRSHWDQSEETNTPAARGTRREFQWRVGGGFERSIQEAYRLAIDQAEKYIYIETQYLIGSGAQWGRASIANDLEKRIVDRTISRIRDGLPFHSYIVMPMFPEGVPTSMAAVSQRSFEWQTMQYMAQAIHRVAQPLGKDWRDYVSFCFLAKWNTVAPGERRTTGSRADRVRANKRYMIYVHSKLMIVDDRYIIFGSANLNERSLAGDRDLEICCGMWPTRGREKECVQQLRNFRKGLWEEHFGTLPSGWENPESAACVADARAKGRSNYKNFRELTNGPADGHLCIWPFHADTSAFYVETVSRSPEGDLFLPDGVYNEGSQGSRYEWLWHSPGWHLLNLGGAAE
jgi:phosphatidylserine/phosphatidylglycerophosphate/cardiolipin synthase-like enzyme